MTFEDIKAAGLERWLAVVGEAVRTETYRVQPVRRVLIPKPGGGERPLGIPVIQDRVVQTAALLILQRIFEADLDPTAYGYRPGRSALDASEKMGGDPRCGNRSVSSTEVLIPVELAAQGVSGPLDRALDGGSLRDAGTLRGEVRPGPRTATST